MSQLLEQIDAPSLVFETGLRNGSSEDAGEGPQLHIVAILNPLSAGAQRIAPVLEFLRSSLQPHIQVQMVETVLRFTDSHAHAHTTTHIRRRLQLCKRITALVVT